MGPSRTLSPYNPKTEFWSFFVVNLASGGFAGAFSLSFVYPLDYARTRLASDVGSGKKTFNGLGDCLKKTAQGPKGFLSLYNGFGISVAGIIPYRGVQFGLNDTIKGLNPFDKETGLRGIASSGLVPSSRSSCLASSPTHSTPCVVVCRWSPSSLSRSACTKVPSTVPTRSSRTRV